MVHSNAMLTVLSFHAGDAALALRLLRWIENLGGCAGHRLILLADSSTPFDQCVKLLETAKPLFATVGLTATEEPVRGWIAGANSQWWAATQLANGEPFLWLEPDAVPLCPGWLNVLEGGYSACGKEHMGQIEKVTNAGLPPECLSGVAIYGPSVQKFPDMRQFPRPFNVDGAGLIVPKAAHTPLIRDFFGQMNLPPFFVRERTPSTPPNAFTLDWLPKHAVLFHRDKTHSLMPLLHAKLFPDREAFRMSDRPAQKLVVVFPVHNGDIRLAMHHATWLQKMGRVWDWPAVIAHDPSLPVPMVAQFRAQLEKCFGSVSVMTYPTPNMPYPGAANWTWQHTALAMQEPWLWFEADMVALKPDWIEQLQNEYDASGKEFMGVIVPNLGHLQGTAVYPAGAAQRMPAAMRCGPTQAFDMQTQEILPYCHEASSLIFHVWSILNGEPCPVGGGEVPSSITAEQARRWIPKTAVLTHRWKSHHLINLLLSGAYKP